MPYFFSDQFDLSMEYTGFAPSWDRVVFRGDPSAGGAFHAFWLEGGRVIAGMKANGEGSIKPVTALVTARPIVKVERLTDPTVPLDDIEALTRSLEVAA